MKRRSDRDLWIWVYQRSKCKCPWALRLHGMKRGSAYFFDSEIYAEFIPNRQNMLVARGCRFRILHVPRGDESGVTSCVVSELPGLLIDICHLYGGEVTEDDLKMIRTFVQNLYRKLKQN